MNLRTALLAATVLAIPSARAQQTVPAVNGQASAPAIPAGMPPPIKLLSPSAPMNPKEKQSASLAASWRNKNTKPVRGADGSVKWTFGASMPSVVCSPLNVCAIALEPGEVISGSDAVPGVNIGDKVQWGFEFAISGTGASRTTLIIVKPHDAGLVTSMMVTTNRRVYAIKLLSTQSQFTPLTSFAYPEADTKTNLHGYYANAAMSAGQPAGGFGPVGGAGELVFYRVDPKGDKPSWTPIRVYSDGQKTYIEFPASIRYDTAPALLVYDNDGGWFSKASEQTVPARMERERFLVVDRVLDHAALVLGVGSGQTRVDIRRPR